MNQEHLAIWKNSHIHAYSNESSTIFSGAYSQVSVYRIAASGLNLIQVSNAVTAAMQSLKKGNKCYLVKAFITTLPMSVHNHSYTKA